MCLQEEYSSFPRLLFVRIAPLFISFVVIFENINQKRNSSSFLFFLNTGSLLITKHVDIPAFLCFRKRFFL